ncbi:MAG: hypothetical protein H6658_12980 [Ardenticatenaceae bacterium]|nr:hypothetical protein [Ardenticatenaceae bacterium]
MSNRIAVMNEGVVQQVGTPREIYEHPNNRFVADFIGETNFLPGSVAVVDNFVTVRVNGVQALGTADGRSLTPDQPVTLAIRPEKINLYPHGRIDILQTEIGLGGEELSQFLGGRVPNTIRDARDYLQLEKNNGARTRKPSNYRRAQRP